MTLSARLVPIAAVAIALALAPARAHADDRAHGGFTASVELGVAATVGGLDDRALGSGTGGGVDLAAGGFVTGHLAALFRVATSVAGHDDHATSSQIFAGPSLQLWRRGTFVGLGVGLAAAQRRTVDMFGERHLGLGLDAEAGAAIAQWHGAWKLSVHVQAGLYGTGTATSLGVMLGYQTF